MLKYPLITISTYSVHAEKLVLTEIIELILAWQSPFDDIRQRFLCQILT
jgi:hypothetical protein